MTQSHCDVAVVGAGAAGLTSAIWSARQSASSKISICLFDSREKIGAKILISGGTRCNVTNRSVKTSDYRGGPAHFVKHVLEAFTPAQTIAFFKEIGVELTHESTGKYFPTTHSGKTVLEALMKEAATRGVTLQTGQKILKLQKMKDSFELEIQSETGNSKILARRVILCTGGLSLPETGSDGTGLQIAQRLGHTLVPTTAALTPLLTDDGDWQALSGIALEASLFYYEAGRKVAETKDSFLFTHFGFSGPSALDISRFFTRAPKESKPEIRISFLPEYSVESLMTKLLKIQQDAPGKQIKNVFREDFSLPERFVETFLKKIGADFYTTVGRIKKVDLTKLAARILDFPLKVTGVYGYKKAEATAGGVDLKEIKFSTMESKLVPGLYFAGEILDIDGRIGGFNFQWAWSTGAIAGKSAAVGLLSSPQSLSGDQNDSRLRGNDK